MNEGNSKMIKLVIFFDLTFQWIISGVIQERHINVSTHEHKIIAKKYHCLHTCFKQFTYNHVSNSKLSK